MSRSNFFFVLVLRRSLFNGAFDIGIARYCSFRLGQVFWRSRFLRSSSGILIHTFIPPPLMLLRCGAK